MAKVIKQARLSANEWQVIRNRWEKDPRDGYAWLVNELDLGISVNAVSQKAKRDGWTKLMSGFELAQAANKRADNSLILKQNKEYVHGNVHENVHVTTSDDDSISIRANILTQHRDDWQEHRATFAIGSMAESLEITKIAKMTAEVIKLRHEGERKAYGLDIVAADTGSGMKTREELNTVFNNMIASVQEEQAKAEERFKRMEAEGL
jgi:hypothetical protein